jgi:hypothetical protein
MCPTQVGVGHQHDVRLDDLLGLWAAGTSSQERRAEPVGLAGGGSAPLRPGAATPNFTLDRKGGFRFGAVYPASVTGTCGGPKTGHERRLKP